MRAGVRRLTEHDEEALKALLRANYGGTYAHRGLYELGGVTRLLASGRATLWGDFDAEGQLLAHTAIFEKDPRGDYVESGLSLRNVQRPAGTSTPDAWRLIRASLTQPAFVHQHTTTWHVLAQGHAERHMDARPCGLIFGYTEGERLVGHDGKSGPMDALTMTSVLDETRLRTHMLCMLPRGPWGDWLTHLFAEFGLACDLAAHTTRAPFTLHPFEHVEALSLTRCVVKEHDEGALEAASPAARTRLVHLPVDTRVAHFERLLEDAYLPIGIRVHATRPDEIILQWMPEERRAEALERITTLALSQRAQRVIDAWQKAYEAAR